MKYLVEMTDMGCGLTRESVMELAFTCTIVQKSGRKNPFHGGKVGLRGISTAPPTVIFTATLLLPSHFLQPSNSS